MVKTGKTLAREEVTLGKEEPETGALWSRLRMVSRNGGWFSATFVVIAFFSLDDLSQSTIKALNPFLAALTIASLICFGAVCLFKYLEERPNRHHRLP